MMRAFAREYCCALLMVAALVGSASSAVRVCVAGRDAEAACRKMEARKNPVPLTCFVTQDRYDCLLRLVTKEADVALAGPEDVYLAKEMLYGKVFVIGQTRTIQRRTESMKYDGVAVVRRTTVSSLKDLSGATSCHTGYGRTAGWYIPIAHLLEMKKLKLSCGSGLVSVEKDLKAISNFFGLACLPGSWAPDNTTDARLKRTYPNLCSMCANPGECSGQDLYSGYEGALECLTKANGDVAWTKHDAVLKYFNTTERESLKAQYALLCPDGSIRDLDQPCPWASKPWDAWLTRTGYENLDQVTKSLKMAMESATIGNERVSSKIEEWATPVLGIKQPSTVVAFNPPTTPLKYLSTAAYDITIERLSCPEDPFRLCVTSTPALDKCRALSQVLKSRRVRPELACELASAPGGDCSTAVAGERSDLAVLDGGDVYKAHVEYGLTPLAAEKYGLQDSSYYAVAVVKADSGISRLSDLKGKKSCHTAIDTTAGWKTPVVSLLEAGLIKRGSCNYAEELASFFSASCVPGAKTSQYDPYGANPESLCQLCVGTEVRGAEGPSYAVSGSEGWCERSSAEAYYGYEGAFRCLVEGGGDVAFVKHTTVGETINSKEVNASWAENLSTQDFRLLCKQGGTADVVDFASCHLAKVPSNKVVVRSQLASNRKEEARMLLTAAATMFPPGQFLFTLFGPYHGHNNLIFKDTATTLVISPDDSFRNPEDEAYYRMLTELQACVPDPIDESAYYTPRPGSEAGGLGANGLSRAALSLPSLLVPLVAFVVVVWGKL